VTPPPPFGIVPNPQGPIEVAAVKALNVGFAVAFQAGELLLLGVVQTANSVATNLAATGDIGSALAAGVGTAQGVVNAALGIVAAQSSTSPLQAAGAVRQSVAAPAPTPAIAVGLPGLNVLTKAVGVLTTTAEQTIQVALSLAVGGLVGTPIVLSGVSTALKNLAANGNIGEFLGAALAAENTGFTTAVASSRPRSPTPARRSLAPSTARRRARRHRRPR
jgi:hypothetical protein